ncbi:MAG: hypothetical protein K6A44_00645 [bacterium]|nr:hypothetical protein [bacterium]
MAENKEYMHLAPRKAVSSHIHGFCGFTLAETLITLLVIGVVAVLTIPALTQQITNYTLNKQKKVFSTKWAEGLRRMRVDGKLAESYTTESFVNEMKKYFSIAAVCDSENLTNCFTETITTYENGTDGEVFEVKDLKSAKNFNKSEEDSPVYGLKFSDGTNMLISYKKDCKGIDEGDTTGNTSACILYVYDVNGNKSPNKYGGNTGAGVKKDDKELTAADRENINNGRDLVGNASITKGNAYGLSFEIVELAEPSTYGYYGADYWLAAKNYCENKGLKLPNKAQVDEIAAKLYIKSGYCTGITSISEGIQRDIICDTDALTNDPLWKTFAGGNDRFILWTDAPNGDNNAILRSFLYNLTGYYPTSRYVVNLKAICVEK